jgi:hypothetical protein
MANASTIRRQVSGTQQLTLASLTAATAATETPFSLNNNGITLTGGGIIPLAAGNFGIYAGTGQVFKVHAAATMTGGTATGTLGLNLYVVPAASLPFASTVVTAANVVTAGGILLVTGQVATLDASTTSMSYVLDAYLQLDAKGNLYGNASSGGAGDFTAPVVTVEVTGLVGEADLNFLMSAVTTTQTTGTIVLNEFSIDIV